MLRRDPIDISFTPLFVIEPFLWGQAFISFITFIIWLLIHFIKDIEIYGCLLKQAKICFVKPPFSLQANYPILFVYKRKYSIKNGFSENGRNVRKVKYHKDRRGQGSLLPSAVLLG